MKISQYLSSLVAFLFLTFLSGCCGSGDDGQVIDSIQFRIFDSHSDYAYFGFGGKFIGDSPNIFLEDNITPANYEDPNLDNGYILLYYDGGYGENINNEIRRKYFIHLPDSDIDTMEIVDRIEDEKCDNLVTRFDRVIFNDSTFINQVDLYK